MHNLLRFLGIAADTEFLGNPLSDWVSALVIALATFAALLVLRRQLVKRARRHARQALPSGVRLVLTIAGRTRVLPLLGLSLLAGSKYLDLGTRAERITSAFLVIAVLLQVGLWASTAVRFWLDEHDQRSPSRDAQTTATIVQFVANLAIWSIVVLLALDNLGVQVKALLTGLGIGGIAVALAVQSVLGDLLASVSIALDKPFGVGDALVLDSGFSGTVEAIGIKSTRLRSVSGEQIVLANSELVKARIRNYGRLSERRNVLRFGLAHGTAAAELATVPALVEAAVRAQPLARFERAHLVAFSANAIEFEVAYVVASADYRAYLDVQQAVQVALAAGLEARGVEFASLTPVVAHAHRLAGGAS